MDSNPSFEYSASYSNVYLRSTQRGATQPSGPDPTEQNVVVGLGVDSNVRAAQPHMNAGMERWHIEEQQAHERASSIPTQHMHLPGGIAQSRSPQYMQYPVAGELFVDHQPMSAPTPSHFDGGSLDFGAPFGTVSPSTYTIPHLPDDNLWWNNGGCFPATTPSSPVYSSAGSQAHQPLEWDSPYHNSSSDFTRRRSTSEPSNYPPAPFFSPLSSSDYTPQTQQLFATRRRNAAIPVPGIARQSASKWECPYCSYVQQGRRNQDLRRHMETHTRSDVALWSCCGVPLSQSHHYGVPDASTATSAALFIGDDFMVGGCQQSFSRKDALQRHLRERKGRCFGDPLAAWHPGNRKKVEM